MIHPGNLDWWLFIYSPSMLFSAAFFLGWKRWAINEKLPNLFPMFSLCLLGIVGRFLNLFPISSFIYFSALYFSCFWLLIANRRTPGIVIFSSGGILNAVAALINGGKMPVLGQDIVGRFHQAMNPSTRFVWICDYIETPTGLYMMSPGDFLLILGAVIFFMQELRIFIKNRRMNSAK